MSSEAKTFDGQVVLISGAAQGIGRAAAKLFQSRGAHVIAFDIDREKLNVVQSELGLKDDQVYALDLGDAVAVKELIAKVYSRHGQIHALVNSAGIVGPSNTKVEDVKWEDYERTVRINLFGAIWLTQAVIVGMKEHGYGRIVHLASIAGKEGNPGMAPYNTSKSGLIGFIKGVAKEVAQQGITINAVAPAVIRTPMNENTSEETLKYMLARIPMGRLGEAEEIAELLAFIASKECSFTTGFTFDASGGRATY
ncbi:MAG: SDR family NAD(P)-dependent oxidoreductase [Actinomycetota bacterium]